MILLAARSQVWSMGSLNIATITRRSNSLIFTLHLTIVFREDYFVSSFRSMSAKTTEFSTILSAFSL